LPRLAGTSREAPKFVGLDGKENDDSSAILFES